MLNEYAEEIWYHNQIISSFQVGLCRISMISISIKISPSNVKDTNRLQYFCRNQFQKANARTPSFQSYYYSNKSQDYGVTKQLEDRSIEHIGGPTNAVGLIVPTEECKQILACLLESQFKMYYRLIYKKKTVKLLENN